MGGVRGGRALYMAYWLSVETKALLRKGALALVQGKQYLTAANSLYTPSSYCLLFI